MGSTLPLTKDPPVIWFWKWIGWKDYEVPNNHNLESVSAKTNYFCHPHPPYPPIVPAETDFFLPLHGEASGIRPEDVATRTGLLCYPPLEPHVGTLPSLHFLMPHTSETHAHVGGWSRIVAVCLNRRSRVMAPLCPVSVINTRSCRSSFFPNPNDRLFFLLV
jgi:hypothetical protein